MVGERPPAQSERTGSYVAYLPAVSTLRSPNSSTGRPLRSRILLSLAAVLLAVALGGALGSSAAWAEEAVVEAEAPAAPAAAPAPDAAPGPGKAAEGEPPMTAEDMERWIRESPLAFGSVIVLRYGALLLGLVFLVLAWRRYDRVRAGIAPPPPQHAPTLLFTGPQAFALLAGFYILGSLIGGGLLAVNPALQGSIVFQLAAAQLMLLPLAVVVIGRRRQLRAGPKRSAGWVVGGGFGTFCVASAFVVPTMMLSVLVLTMLGRPLDLQGPVQELARGGRTALPWILAFFAVVLAPIAEESVFRGLLYPALRGQGATRRRKILAAVLVSSFFALIHFNEASFLPLFVLAMVLAWVFERTNSLATVMVAHGLWNLSTVFPLIARAVA